MTDYNDVLKEYFSDFKQSNLIIWILFTVIIALIQIVQSVWVSKKIEKFKTDLKKSEIKFSRYHNLQVDALKSIYDKLVSFHGANFRLFQSKYKLNDHSYFKIQINNWLETYWECSNVFNHEKLLLPNHIKVLVKKVLENFSVVKNILINEETELNLFEEMKGSDWNQMYKDSEDELDAINKKINALKLKPEIQISESDIISLRKSIEDYFEEMNK